ncbi:DNA-binding transcriptional regulator, MarR family [Agromyces sp. CF514]|uniref:MarR family winged helix-turn-helix transcriptional regulator n=1 Tax=Agromyces sp. CF514 TaxID=1881031 RepID=UPI0008E89DA2|nr:MarR family winged helix-turn-helix transcriptional regulator [Agromyces sp. CF514]SFR69661.1 DNA-binding transcriptional regulator, MarR family [Agromyces sp. CF514]
MTETDASGPPLTTSLDLMRWIGWEQRRAFEDWMRSRDLSHEQAFVLGYLAQHPGSIQRDLADVSRTTPASVSSLLQGLERRALIERRADEANARVKRVYATPAGAELVSGFGDAAEDVNRRVLAPLTPAERDRLHALLTKITDPLPRPSRD